MATLARSRPKRFLNLPDRLLKYRFLVLRTRSKLWTSCVSFEFFILLQLLRYIVCEEEIEEGGDFRGIVFRRGRISFIGFDIGWFSFFHGGELGKKAV